MMASWSGVDEEREARGGGKGEKEGGKEGEDAKREGGGKGPTGDRKKDKKKHQCCFPKFKDFSLEFCLKGREEVRKLLVME